MPPILELPGIGAPDVLETAGVQCLVASPGVGANFQDHVVSGPVYELYDVHISF